jgi:uncharacterized protein (TIGR02246 family)
MPTTELTAAITTANAARSEAVAAQDAGAVLSLYTADAIVLPPGSAPICGRDAIQDWYTTAFGMGIAWLEVMTDSLRSVNDTTLVEQGRYRIGQGPDEVADAGSYTVYWVCCDGDWRIFRDVIMSADASQ